jgi:hypothetical protein
MGSSPGTSSFPERIILLLSGVALEGALGGFGQLFKDPRERERFVRGEGIETDCRAFFRSARLLRPCCRRRGSLPWSPPRARSFRFAPSFDTMRLYGARPRSQGST